MESAQRDTLVEEHGLVVTSVTVGTIVCGGGGGIYHDSEAPEGNWYCQNCQ